MKVLCLGPPVVPFYPFLEEGSLLKETTEEKKGEKNTKKTGTLILASLLEDLVATEAGRA